MKLKIIPILICFICLSVNICIPSFAASKFTNKFASCSKYYQDDGNRITIILGWANRLCYYQEITAQKTVECKFKKLQVDEISAELRNKNIQNATIESLTSGQKYFDREDVCEVTSK